MAYLQERDNSTGSSMQTCCAPPEDGTPIRFQNMDHPENLAHLMQEVQSSHALNFVLEINDDVCCILSRILMSASNMLSRPQLLRSTSRLLQLQDC
jgi:hypothetical protein